ncbi:AraC family transcriptional regulator [Marinilabiliaceae bacterium JC017]|nr:AraC family transcriptional regulator [Marinilabiliaceae bacterium JC017]
MVELKSTEEIVNILKLKRRIIHKDIIAFKFDEVNPQDPLAETGYHSDFFEIVIAKQDSGTLLHRHKVYTNLDNTLNFLSPMQMVKYIPSDISKSDTGISILFKASLFFPVLQNYDIRNDFPFFKIHTSPIYRLTEQQTHSLYPLFESLYHESLQNDIGSLRIIRAYLDIILNSCLRVMKQNVETVTLSRPETITCKFEELVASYQPEFKSLKDYAANLNISPVYLSECIKKVTGKTARQVMVDYRLLKAKSLLKQYEMPIKEIACELGFDEVTNFTKFFKKHTGHTPSQFRHTP